MISFLHHKAVDFYRKKDIFLRVRKLNLGYFNEISFTILLNKIIVTCGGHGNHIKIGELLQDEKYFLQCCVSRQKISSILDSF